MNHFHSPADFYRLCHACFVNNLSRISDGSFVAPTRADGERPECARISACFSSSPYMLFVSKLCDGCKQYPEAHFHDIHRNIRLCLPCFQDRRFDYALSGAP